MLCCFQVAKARTSAVSVAAMEPAASQSESPPAALTQSASSEHSYATVRSPRKLKRRCDELEEELRKAKRALYNAERREIRAKSTVSHLLAEAAKKKLIASEASRLLDTFGHIPVQLFRKNSSAYTEEQRQFATTLHFYSPKAYDFCRKHIPLPAESTLRRWLSGIDCHPGFSDQVFSALKARTEGDAGWQYKTCTVMIDGMAIRKHVDWDTVQQRMIGFTDLGSGSLDDDSQAEATEVLVIMAVGLTGHWKVTLGYFLITGISATVQAQLLLTALRKLHEAGIRGIALVMDGHSTNQATVAELGGSLSPANLVSHFRHPSESQWHVYIFFDACHMLKLLRNALEAMKQIVLPGFGTARWADIVNLHELQHREGLRAANRLTLSHILFQRQKMKVRLAAQTLSASVGTALQFLSANKVQGFGDTQGTQKFVFMIDRLFDTFNSRTPKASGYKQALMPSTVRRVLPFLHECKDLLLTMTNVHGQKICESRRRMAAVGFVVNITSLTMLCSEILPAESPFHQQYLLTYKLSQDHLELYFSSIRRLGGWNNNPSAYQFAHAYRALLSRTAICGGSTGNVVQQDHTDLLHLSAEARKVEHFTSAQLTVDHDYCAIRSLSLFVSNVVEYISGWVIRKLSPQIACGDCVNALLATADGTSHTDSLLEIKNHGGLVKPSAGVVTVVKHAEKVLREHVNFHKVTKLDIWGQALESTVLQQLPNDIFPDMNDHFRDSQYGIDSHYSDLVRNICRTFLKLRRFHVINVTNQQLKGRSVRQALTKTILFKNQ